ncbi:MAG TPA: RidA family protein [Bacteroidetes bacterium]|nr:RidA family protein [Bacteroidota bacterium]
MITVRTYLRSLLALFILSSVAFTQDDPSERRFVNLQRTATKPPYSDGVLVGNTYYLAGRLGTDPKTGQIPEDAEQEIRFLLDGVRTTLSEAGMTMNHLVSVQVYCPDLALYDKFNAVYKTYFTRNFPARAFIGSGPLLRGARFEIQGIAVK